MLLHKNKNKNCSSRFIFFLILLFNLLCSYFVFASDTAPIAINGIIDLQDFCFDDSLFLSGDWLFSPDNGALSTNMNSYNATPKEWNYLLQSDHSSGTYTLQLKLSPDIKGPLALKIPEFNQHVSISINNIVAYTTGMSDNLRQNSSIQIIPFKPLPQTVISLYFYNKYQYNGIKVPPIEIGTYQNIQKKQNTQATKKAVMIGFMLFIWIFFLFLFIAKYPQRAALYLSFVAFFGGMRFLSNNEFIYTFFSSFSILKYKVHYMATFLGSSFSLLFLQKLLKNQPKKLIKIQTALIIISFVFSASIAILPIKVVSRIVPSFIIFGLITLFFIFIEAILSLKTKGQNRIFAIFLILVSCFLAFSFVYTYQKKGMPTINLNDLGVFAFTMLFTAFLSQNISQALKQSENISLELEKEVINRTNQLNKTIEKLRLLSSTDALTGIYNLRKFTELGEREVSIHQRHKRPLSLILFDIDSFKTINDTYGHKTGDITLKFLTSTCRQEIRGSDILGRIGGDEFALLLLETPIERAGKVAENLRHTIHESSKKSSEVPEFTVSMGVVTLKKREILDIAKQRADVCLYKAKNLTRNMVYTESSAKALDSENDNPAELLEEVDDE